MPTVFFKTFGCRTNLFDTAVMRSLLKNFTLAENEQNADIIIVNSCTVTNAADSSVRGYVRRVHSLGKKVFFSGCGVHTQGKELFEQGLVHSVFSHGFKEHIDELLRQEQRFYKIDSQPSLDSTLVSDFVGKSRAFIKIQEGCDFACSYCIIPTVRGVARSFSERKILEQVRILVDRGFSEFILTGTNSGSYGRGSADKEHASLARLVRKMAKITGVRRIRLGSLEPSQIDDEFFELLGESFMAKHLHIALQHTHNTMLTIMNRKNRFEHDYILFEKIAKLGYAIGSDYIVGHPGEDDVIFNDGLKNLAALPLTHVHPFIYSPRDGTLSSTMKPTVKGNVAKERLHIVKSLVESNNYKFRQRMQNEKIPLEILIEGQGSEKSGLDQFFNRMSLKDCSVQVGEWVVMEEYHVRKEGNYAKVSE